MHWLYDPEVWIALVTLTALEIVLGIDNIVFISIQAGQLPSDRQPAARRLGLLAAMGTRILLLLSIVWVIRLTGPLFTVFGEQISGHDLILLAGGLFLLSKSTREIHDTLEADERRARARARASFTAVVVQIGLLDIVFSMDSVITAIGMTGRVGVMIAAIVIAVLLMMVAANPIGDFVEKHPTVRMLALSFLLLIGVALVGEAFDLHIPKGYIYFAMGFSVMVEMLNLRARHRTPDLRHPTPGT